MSGIEGKIHRRDERVRGRNEVFESLAHEVKSIVGGPDGEVVQLNFANSYDEIAKKRARPSNLYAAEDGAREIDRAADPRRGYDSVSVGGLDEARRSKTSSGRCRCQQDARRSIFDRYARPGQL